MIIITFFTLERERGEGGGGRGREWVYSIMNEYKKHVIKITLMYKL